MDLGIPGLENAEPVGQGGFATVYKARQPAFARTVAVKVLTGTHFDEDSRLRFERELHALGLLSEHPAIVTVHDTGFTTDGRPYLTMAFVDEGTLADRLDTRGPVPWAEAVAILIRLAGALETAHRNDIIHRDIKPANVLLSRYGAQLSDFGIARIAGAHETQAGVVTASIAYAAPEVLNGDRPTIAADIYSLGSTAYALLLAKSPFERSPDETFIPLMLRIQTEAAPDLRAHGVPADLAALLARTLAKDPADRPGSALEFGRSLQEVMRSHGQRVPDLILAPDLSTDVDEPPRANETRRVGGTHEPALAVHGSGTRVVETGPDETGPGDPPAKRRRVGGFVAAAGLAVVVLAGVAFATRGSDGDGDAGASIPTDTEPAVTEPMPNTEPPAVVPLATESTAVTVTQEPEPSPVATDQPAAPAEPPPAMSTLPSISDEPVCGTDQGFLPSGDRSVNVILDTGIGVGVDDLGALAVLHALADAGEAEVLATMVSVGGDDDAGRTVDAVNTYYRRPDVPIGVVTGPAPSGPSPYTAELAANFPNDLVDPSAAVDLYRQVLAGQPDDSVTIVSTGFLTNLAELLASPPDDASGLTGRELVEAKVTRWVAMGGAYPRSTDHLDDPEFNFARDTPAAQSTITGWPTPAVFSGFEVGNEIQTGAVLQTETPPTNPVREGYRLWGLTDGASSFDLTAVLAAVRGTADAFEICTGRNIVGSGGATTWEHREGGQQGYLRMVAPSEQIADTLDALLTAPPAG